MILAIDIGNTHTVVGIFDKHKLLGDWRVTSFITRTDVYQWSVKGKDLTQVLSAGMDGLGEQLVDWGRDTGLFSGAHHRAV